MAAPGEFFPMQFASAILSLKQQRLQADAQLTELKRSREVEEKAQASRDFWNRVHQQESLSLQRDSLAAQEARASADAESQKEANSARIQLTLKQMEAEREATKVKSLSDLATRGAAFIPTDGYAEYTKLRDSLAGSDDGRAFHEVPIPGKGLLVTRLQGSDALEQRKQLAEIEKLESERAVSDARVLRYQTQNALDIQKAQTLTGKLSIRDTLAVQNALSRAHEVANQKALEAENAGDPGLASRIRRDPWSAFPDDQKGVLSQWQVILSSSTSALQKGMILPENSDPRALEVAGVSAALDAAHMPQPGQAPRPAAQAAPASAPPAARVSGHVRGGGTDTFVVETQSGSRTYSDADVERLVSLIETNPDPNDPAVQHAISVLTAIASWTQSRAAGVSIFSRNE